MTTPRKRKAIPRSCDTYEPLREVCFDGHFHPDQVKLIFATFGASSGEVVDRLLSVAMYEGARLRSRLENPTWTEAVARLDAAADAIASAASLVNALGPSAFMALFDSADPQATPHNHALSLRSLAERYRAAADAKRGVRRGRPSSQKAALPLGLAVAQVFIDYGAEPKTTEGGAFTEVLEMVLSLALRPLRPLRPDAKSDEKERVSAGNLAKLVVRTLEQ